MSADLRLSANVKLSRMPRSLYDQPQTTLCTGFLPHPDSRPSRMCDIPRTRIQCRRRREDLGEYPDTVGSTSAIGTPAFNRRADDQSCGLSEGICKCGLGERNGGVGC